MNPLSAIFGAAVRGRNELYDRGKLPIHRLKGPVISVGNLSVGGSGKTPFVITLGQLLQQRGVAFDVLSRGYRRRTKGVALVDPSGSPDDFGDEPLLIARKLAVPVIVGEDRFAAGQLAEQQFGPQWHLLDDGFQHRRLHRDFDVVLLTPGDREDSLLPTGRLREPLSSLSRADAIVLPEDMPANGLPLTSQHIWRVSRPLGLPGIEETCVAFCGIARPEQFFAQLRAAGVNLVATLAFGDHHRYGASDVQQLITLRRQSQAAAFVTTEKDAINLRNHLPELGPKYVAELRMKLLDESAALDQLIARIA